jgi:hypothetical protein
MKRLTLKQERDHWKQRALAAKAQLEEKYGEESEEIIKAADRLEFWRR